MIETNELLHSVPWINRSRFWCSPRDPTEVADGSERVKLNTFQSHSVHVYHLSFQAPEDALLKRMKNIWQPYRPGIDDLTTFTWPQDQNSPRYILADLTREWAEMTMRNAVFEREDYMELTELIAAYLGVPVSN